MTLNPEWRRRVEDWQGILATLSYRPLATTPLQGFETLEQFTPAQASRKSFRPMAAGMPWGPKWGYAWFRTEVRVPASARGARIVFRPDFQPEALVFVNGGAAGGADHWHREITLTKRAKGGERFRILFEVYAGHGPAVCGTGPVPEGVIAVPEPAPQQHTVGESSFGIWDEDLFQLWLDVETLFQLRDRLDADSLRVAEIDAALRDYTVLCDLELPREGLLRSARAARKRLAPVLACTNGSTSPLLYAFGHSHIDVAWLWPLQETERKVCRTSSTMLALMDEYPEYRFLQSQPHLYRMLKRLDPALYGRVKRAVKRGQFVPEGGMWVEADTNITGGESLIRQFVHGKRFFRDEFGVESKLLWLPDVFGYCGALPQIMAGCGIQYFSTAKIFWNYSGGENFPHNTFFWEGIDGTRTLTHLHNDYNSHTNPAAVMSRWNERVQKDGIHTRLMPFGWGDGGGGAQRDHLEFLRRERNLEGLPRTRIASPIDYFTEQEKETAHLPVYVGELYFQCHRGTYTSQARTKRGNRRCEFALREAEMWGAAAARLAGFAYPASNMDEAWKGVLLNQFHDIIPGSSIHRVYVEAERTYDEVLATAQDVGRKAARSLLARSRTAVTAFNSLSWDRRMLVPLPAGFSGAATLEGEPLPVQRVDGVLHAEVPDVPSCGWRSILACPTRKNEGTALQVSTHALENEHLKLHFNNRGEITSLKDKATGRELAEGVCNSLHMYKDVPTRFDAWDIDSPYKESPVALDEPATLTVTDKGPLVAGLTIKRTIGNSTMTQVVRLRRGSRRVDFITRIDWQERHKLLKVNFPVAIRSDEAIHEIQFGHISRPTHASRQFDADRFEVSAHKWTALSEQNRGCAVLNDCKYGVSVENNSINLTLLRSPVAPDMTADLGIQEFTYSFYAWNGSFGDSGIVREAYDLNTPAPTLPGKAERTSLFRVDAANVVIDTVKPAEDGSGDLIVRLYESKRMSTDCCVETALPVKTARLDTMLEEPQGRLRVARGKLRLSFRPFEIKTVRLAF